MADIEVQYKGSTIKQQTGSGTVTLHTEGKYMEDDVDIVYVAPSAPAPASLDDDVVFIDYDGTPLYSYTKADFANLDALPANPTHSGLIAQGWNWSLADAKSYVADMDGLVIGQNYITDDDKTRLYITLEEPLLEMKIRFWADASGKVVIDWGDGTTETPTGTGLKTIAHSYASAGDYIVTLYPTSGNFKCNGSIMDQYNTRDKQKRIRKVEIGKNFLFGGDTFRGCILLETITVPSTASYSQSPGATFYECYSLKCLVLPASWNSTSSSLCYNCRNMEVFPAPKTMAVNAQCIYGCSALIRFHIPPGLTGLTGSTPYFSGCTRLHHIKIPSTITEFGQAFSGLNSLEELILPDGTTTIGANMCTNCYSLTKMTIPALVTSIGASAFSNCLMCELHLKPTTPPTLSNTNAFSFATGAKIYVPTGKLSAYQSATGWSTWASNMVEESA